MRLTVRQLKRIISEGVKRVILEAGVHHDTSGMDHEGEARYYELWNMLQNNNDYQQEIAAAVRDGYLDEYFVESIIYSFTGAVQAGVDQYVVERLAQNIVNDLS